MSALKRIHSELAALIYDVEDDPPPATTPDNREWWEMSDDEFIASRIAEYQAEGGSFVEVWR